MDMEVASSRITYSSPWGTEIEIFITTPHQFAREQQNLFFPSWDQALSYLILVLQRSSLSLSRTTPQVALEKNRLRANFISFGRNVISSLQSQQYLSDLFDPRTGQPLLSNSGLVWDDNATVQALLNYPVINWQNCSLLQHPVWNHNVYPATIATTAPQVTIESCLDQISTAYNWDSRNIEDSATS